jgi:hypothetical protein
LLCWRKTIEEFPLRVKLSSKFPAFARDLPQNAGFRIRFYYIKVLKTREAEKKRSVHLVAQKDRMTRGVSACAARAIPAFEIRHSLFDIRYFYWPTELRHE